MRNYRDSLDIAVQGKATRQETEIAENVGRKMQELQMDKVNAILDNIPRTKDGVMVTQCVEFWIADIEGAPISTNLMAISIAKQWEACFRECQIWKRSTPGHMNIKISNCYSSRAALEADNDKSA